MHIATEHPEVTARSQRALGVVEAASQLFYAAILLYSVHASLPQNAVTLPIESRISARTWGPQQWKFFSRDPEAPQLHVYLQDSRKAWSKLASWPNAQVQNLWGLNRIAQAEEVEAELLIGATLKSSWRECETSPKECFRDTRAWVTVANPSPDPSLCGRVAFVRQKPVPWAWAKHSAIVSMPSQFLVLEVRC